MEKLLMCVSENILVFRVATFGVCKVGGCVQNLTSNERFWAEKSSLDNYFKLLSFQLNSAVFKVVTHVSVSW